MNVRVVPEKAFDTDPLEAGETREDVVVKHEEVSVGFEAGTPVSLNGTLYQDPVQLMVDANSIGGRHGLACDNVMSVEIVSADAALRVASASEQDDLFWAVCGGGANLGIVTSFEYRLHRVGPVLGGSVFYPLDNATRVLRFYDEFARACPDELSANAALATADDGTPVVGIGVAYIGPPEAGERLVKPLRSLAPPVVRATLFRAQCSPRCSLSLRHCLGRLGH